MVLILWGLLGCASLYMHFALGPEFDPNATDYDRQLYASLPIWLNIVYVAAVSCGLIGAIELLVRNRGAVLLSALSVVLVTIQFGWMFLATDIIAVKGVWTTYFPALIIAVQLFQLWFASRAKGRGLLR
ncbi:hypothetical protein ABS767_13575 [Sphingomonas sp. ST-64]|uniref:Sugar transporter n=1 Tax=Sphingomonas plantiphila TaxID=3163295 RepID=A0ABW8YPN8_9SPHN